MPRVGLEEVTSSAQSVAKSVVFLRNWATLINTVATGCFHVRGFNNRNVFIKLLILLLKLNIG